MTIISCNNSLELGDVLSLRKRMREEDMSREIMKLAEFIEKSNLVKTGPMVTTTFGVEKVGEDPILDMEILIPVDKAGKPRGEYQFKKNFRLVNAVRIRHLGHPGGLRNTYNKLREYMLKNRLQQITPPYNVQVNRLQPEQSLDEMIIDVYVGVNASIL